MSLQYSFCFVAEGNIGFVVEYVDNFPFYYTAFMHVQVHFFLFQHFFHVSIIKTTSSMIQSGVDAPAVMPILSRVWNHSDFSSSAVSI